jgi:hypothetical protein
VLRPYVWEEGGRDVRERGGVKSSIGETYVVGGALSRPSPGETEAACEWTEGEDWERIGFMRIAAGEDWKT